MAFLPLRGIEIRATARNQPLYAVDSAMTHSFNISQDSKLTAWCMRQLVYIENCMDKSPIVKKQFCK